MYINKKLYYRILYPLSTGFYFYLPRNVRISLSIVYNYNFLLIWIVLNVQESLKKTRSCNYCRICYNNRNSDKFLRSYIFIWKDLHL